jgi:hypothetical protein
VPHPKHDLVRARWGASCGYCGVTEADTAGDLTVDHYVPVVAGGDDSDDNLVYCCFRCNLFKADFYPTPEDRAAGRIVLHPSRDDMSVHVRFLEAKGELEALTETGRFHIALLHLNRPTLVAHRLRRRFHELLRERRELVEAECAELRAIINAQEKYIAHLKRVVQGREDVR